MLLPTFFLGKSSVKYLPHASLCKGFCLKEMKNNFKLFRTWDFFFGITWSSALFFCSFSSAFPGKSYLIPPPTASPVWPIFLIFSTTSHINTFPKISGKFSALFRIFICKNLRNTLLETKFSHQITEKNSTSMWVEF